MKQKKIHLLEMTIDGDRYRCNHAIGEVKDYKRIGRTRRTVTCKNCLRWYL